MSLPSGCGDYHDIGGCLETVVRSSAPYCPMEYKVSYSIYPAVPSNKMNVQRKLADRKLSGEGNRKLSGEGNRKLSGEGNRKLSGEGNRKLSGDGNRKFSGEGNRKLPGEGNKKLSGEGNRKLSGEGNRKLSGEGNRKLSGNDNRHQGAQRPGYQKHGKGSRKSKGTQRNNAGQSMSNQSLNCPPLVRMLVNSGPPELVYIRKNLTPKQQHPALNPATPDFKNDLINRTSTPKVPRRPRTKPGPVAVCHTDTPSCTPNRSERIYAKTSPYNKPSSSKKEQCHVNNDSIVAAGRLLFANLPELVPISSLRRN